MWDKYYSEQQYEEALSYHDKMIEGDDRYFALGNDYYRTDDFPSALAYFSQLDTYQSLYNAGNLMYKVWENNESIFWKTVSWETALDFYEKSIEKKQTLEAQTNYQFVQSKLDELKQKDEESQQQEEAATEKSQDNAQESSDSWQEDEQTASDKSESLEESTNDSQAPIPQPRWEQYKLWEWSEVPEMTEWEKASLEKYIDVLQYEEIQNQRYFNKQWDSSSSQNVYDAFFNQFGSFDSSNSSWEKDW